MNEVNRKVTGEQREELEAQPEMDLLVRVIVADIGRHKRVTSRSVRTGFLIAGKYEGDRCVAAWCTSTSASK
jgi:hypothetical protein